MTAVHRKDQPHAIITGAGSGVGQAVALLLIQRGWSATIIGRRADGLQETIVKAGDLKSRLEPCVLDVSHAESVEDTIARSVSARGMIDALVNAAGTNVPRRSFAQLSHADWWSVLDTNLSGTFHMVRAVLPHMRREKSGTIVNIISDAGLRANAKAGPSYVASKFAVTGLTQSINCEEQKNGIRATAIYPGDINTPLLDKRPVPPPVEVRINMLQPEDVAACVLLAIAMPMNAVIEEMLVRPRGVT